MCKDSLHGMIESLRTCRYAVLGIVFYVYLLDYMLLTAVVPILPELLVESDAEAFSENTESSKNTGLSFGNRTTLVPLLNDSRVQPNDTQNTATQNITSAQYIKATSENSKVGWLLSSKALIQIVASPVIGFLSNRIAYKHLLLFGTGILMTSASLFACSGAFIPLLIARSLQGVGSAAASISGMSLLAESYTDDKERSRVMGIAMSGLGVGVIVGYPFGGLIFAALGQAVPFVGIAAMCLLGIGLQVQLIDRTNGTVKLQDVSTLSMWRLCKDPYILICSGALMITAMSMAVLESTVPIWVMDTMQVDQWELGIIFIPDSLGYFFGIYLFPVVAKKYGRWLFTLGSMLLIAIGTTVLPFCRHLEELVVPHLSVGLGGGITDAAIYPLLALLVDQRHVTTYGCVYAIGQLAICLAYFIGPAIAGQIVPAAGFKWSMWGIAIVNFVFAPLCVFLRDPPILEERQKIIDAMEEDSLHGDGDDEVYNYHTFKEIIGEKK